MANFKVLEGDGYMSEGALLDHNIVDKYFTGELSLPDHYHLEPAFPVLTFPKSPALNKLFSDNAQYFLSDELTEPVDMQTEVAETLVQPPVAITIQSLSLLWDKLIQKLLTLEQDLKRCKLSLADDFMELDNRLNELISSMDSFSGSLDSLLENTRLHPVELSALFDLTHESDLRKRQLKLFRRELDLVHAGNSSKETELVILNQPFPASIMQKTEVENLVCRVLVGPMSDINVSGAEIKVEVSSSSKKVHCNNGSRKKNILIWSKQVSDKLDRTGSLVFSKLKLTSSGSDCVRLRISHGKQQVITAPFVVKSNGNQWEDAERHFLEEQLFGNKKEISRIRFCNLFQRWYILATRQKLDINCKKLTDEDFDYFFETKLSEPKITIPQFKNFWAWIGPIVNAIRFQYRLRMAKDRKSLWMDDVIVGFMGRRKAKQILLKESEGTFLIRVSGEVQEKLFTGFVFSIKSVDSENNPIVKHYLVQENDLRSNQKSIADFAREQTSLTTILSLHTDQVTQKRVLIRSDKKRVLTPYYNLQYEIPTPPPGYASCI